MAYTTINKSSLNMNTKLYNGTGSNQSITGVGFKPDWIWGKTRSSAQRHVLTDVVRGINKQLASDTTAAETSYTNSFTAFGSDGFSVGTDNGTNMASQTQVAWNWLAGGSQGSSNTDGSINTTYTSVNTTAGFSISQYTGTGSAGATFGHGLGSKPAMIIFKCLSVAGPSWVVYHQSKGATYTLYLDQTSAGGASAEMLNNTEPTSSLITLGNGTSSNSSAPTIAYCFAEKQGYSKFGSYIGNGNADGTSVYLGFKPALIIIKNSAGTDNWWIIDNKRSPFNQVERALLPNEPDAESTSDVDLDITAQGFKVLSSSGRTNASGNKYIYMAFAEQPFVTSTGVPATAR